MLYRVYPKYAKGAQRLRLYRCLKKGLGWLGEAHIPLYAGNTAFFLLLSVFPLASLLLAILQRTSLQQADVLRFLAQVSPEALLPLFESLLAGLYQVQPVPLISISAVTAVWSSSKGMYSLLQGLNAVDGLRETRSYLRLRLLCIFCTLAMLLALVVTLLLNVYGKALLRLLAGSGGWVDRVLAFSMRYLHLYSTAFLLLIFTFFYLVLPNARQRLTRVLPGALAAAVAWNVFSSALSIYVNHFPRAASLYGSLTLLLFSLLWLYICISIMFYGALLNRLLAGRSD